MFFFEIYFILFTLSFGDKGLLSHCEIRFSIKKSVIKICFSEVKLFLKKNQNKFRSECNSIKQFNQTFTFKTLCVPTFFLILFKSCIHFWGSRTRLKIPITFERIIQIVWNFYWARVKCPLKYLPSYRPPRPWILYKCVMANFMSTEEWETVDLL